MLYTIKANYTDVLAWSAPSSLSFTNNELAIQLLSMYKRKREIAKFMSKCIAP